MTYRQATDAGDGDSTEGTYEIAEEVDSLSITMAVEHWPFQYICRIYVFESDTTDDA